MKKIAVILLIILLLYLGIIACSDYTDWRVAALKLPDNKHPIITCTPRELQRLQNFYRESSPECKVLTDHISWVNQFIKESVEFPVRGGQHNQWYQCDSCQVHLVTIDNTHHQCPRCKKIYSGEPYDDVLFSRKHRSNPNKMISSAWAYAITREVKYANFTAQVLLGYADRYLRYPYHSNNRKMDDWGKKSGGHIFEQTLDEAVFMTKCIAPAYDLIYDSGVLSDTDHIKIREQLLLPMLKNIDKNRRGKSNWQTWHNAAMLWGGVLVGDRYWIDEAINDPQNGFIFQMKEAVSADGMWYENSWAYHFYTLLAITHIAEGARRIGINLWKHPHLKNMYTLPIYYTTIDGSLPRFGDDVNSSIKDVANIMESAYHAYKDSIILATLPQKPTFNSLLLGRKISPDVPLPHLSSKVFKSSGHAILRTGGNARLNAVLTFGPYGGFHGHFDKLSFVLFGHNKELGVDHGRAQSQAYRLPIHKNWYKATISHNTIVINKKSQEPAEGKLDFFVANENYAAVKASYDNIGSEVKHTRFLLLSPTYLLVFDDLKSINDIQFDWMYHNRGFKVLCEAAREIATNEEGYQGFNYIENANEGISNNTINIRFEDETVTTYLTMAAQPRTKVLIGDGPGKSVLERIPLTMISRNGPGINFVAVLEPVKRKALPLITNVSFSKENKTFKIYIFKGKELDQITLSPRNKLKVTSNNNSAF